MCLPNERARRPIRRDLALDRWLRQSELPCVRDEPWPRGIRWSVALRAWTYASRIAARCPFHADGTFADLLPRRSDCRLWEPLPPWCWPAAPRKLGVRLVSGVVVAAAALAGLYPAYQSLRLRSDYALQIVSGIADRSGWDPSAEGSSTEAVNCAMRARECFRSRSSVSLGAQLSVWQGPSRQTVRALVVLADIRAEYSCSGWDGGQRCRERSRQQRACGLHHLARTEAGLAAHRGFPEWSVLCVGDSARSGPVFAECGNHRGDRNGGGGGPTPVTRGIGTRLLGAPTANQAFAGKEGDFLKSRIAAAQLSWKLFSSIRYLAWDGSGTHPMRAASCRRRSMLGALMMITCGWRRSLGSRGSCSFSPAW